MKTVYFVSPGFEERARAAKPDEDIRVDPRLLGDNWYAFTGNLPVNSSRMPKLPPGWVEEGKAIDGE